MGFPLAQYKISKYYFQGKGVQRNLKISYQWCQKAANNNNTNAQFELGKYYEDGIIVQQNYKIAFDWY